MTEKEVLKIAKSFTKGLLGKNSNTDMCYIVSTALQGYFSMCQYSTNLIEGQLFIGGNIHHHYWLDDGKGRIIDATASQFNNLTGKDMPDIYAGKQPDWYHAIAS